MNIDSIIKDLYSAFSCYERPEHFTNYKNDFEWEEHNNTMHTTTLETFDSEHLGHIGWNPFGYLTEQGFAHYMPRILELVITGKKQQ